MPLLLQKNINPETEIGIWEITESEDYFTDRLFNQNLPQEKLAKKQLEKLAARLLLNEISREKLHQYLEYDSFGKPLLTHQAYQVSMSHKNPFVAVLLSKNNPFSGIDIERIGHQAEKLASKFVNSDDFKASSHLTEQERCALIWAAKESLYKAYGRKEVDFKKHLIIEFFSDNRLEGYINKPQFQKKIDLKYFFIKDMVVVHTL